MANKIRHILFGSYRLAFALCEDCGDIHWCSEDPPMNGTIEGCNDEDRQAFADNPELMVLGVIEAFTIAKSERGSPSPTAPTSNAVH